MSGRAPRVGVIGARRRRQGVGEHLARFVHEAGGAVVAVAGTSAATVEEARRNLSRWGIEAKGHVSAEAMVEAEDLDALVIASPAPLHERHLRLALDAGLHALCEKPLIWRRTPFAEEAARLVDAFRARGLHLAMNAQWPRTLDAYQGLFPHAPVAGARRLRMRMSPASRGYEMLVDAIPHVLSVLDASDRMVRDLADAAARLAGDDASPDLGDLRDVRIEGREERLHVRFLYPAIGREIETDVVLETCLTQPRPASIEFGHEGFVAHRVVREPGYRLSFRAEGEDREVRFEDPMRRGVWEFLSSAETGLLPDASRRLALQARHLERILAAWQGPIGVVAGEEGG